MTTYTNARPPIPQSARTLPAVYYSDSQHFRRELERIHLGMWLHAGRSQQIPSPSDYLLCQIGDASVLVLRDETGQIRAFHNVCRHRGTRLCREEEGRLGGTIRCPYHAWTYSLQGDLTIAPHMEKTEGFCLEDHSLEPIAADVWDGHVFVNLSPAPAPLSSHLADLTDKLRPWRMEELELAKRIDYRVKANWKIILQNYSECLHCPSLHPQFQALSHFMSGRNDPPTPSYLGGRMDLRNGVETLTPDGKSPWAPLPGLGREEVRRVYYYAVLPNLLLNLHPEYMMTLNLWPRAHDETEIVCEWHFHSEEMDRAEFDPGAAVRFWDLTNRQDWGICEQAQRGISSRAYAPGPYSNREELLYALDRWVIERLGEE